MASVRSVATRSSGPVSSLHRAPVELPWPVLLVVLGALVGWLPLEVMLPALAAVGVVVGMLIAPVVGLYALLVAIPFSPSLDVEEAGFSISVFEPLAAVLLLFWLARGVARGQIELPRSGLFGALFLLLCALLVAATGATSLPLAAKETLKWMLLALAFAVTVTQVRSDRGIRTLLTVLFLAGAGQALMGVAQFLGGWGPPGFAIGGFMRAHGMFGQPNPFAGYLGTILPIALAMSLVSSPGHFRYVALFAVVCISAGVALSLSRGSWLGLVLAIGAMALAWGPRTRRLVAPTAAALVLVGMLGVLGALPPALADRVTSITNNFGIFDARDVRPTAENFAVVERMAHWQAGWEMFLDHPIFGVGPGNYPAVYDRYAIPGWRESLGHAHNYYINMAAEAGLAGLIALLVVLALAYRATLRQIRRATEPFRRALAIGLLGSLVVLSVHNMFDNLLVHGVGIQIGMLLGLIGGSEVRWPNQA
jgi:putative inorganic carbon (HCO3(-)) transporter